MRLHLALVVFAAAVVSCGGGSPQLPEPAQPAAYGTDIAKGMDSLGDDFLLFGVPSDDDTLIGKVATPGGDETTGEQQYQANPCLDRLVIRSFEAARTVRDIRKIQSDVNGSVVLQVLRIGASVSIATDYGYEFSVTRKLIADDTIEYADCCSKARGACGSHFVREMYYGSGKYRLLQQVFGTASVGLPVVAEITTGTSYAVLGEQSFKGFFAYKTKTTPVPAPPPLEDRVGFVSTTFDAAMPLPSTVDGAAAIEQAGANLLVTTVSDARFRGNQLKAIGSARQAQRRALKNLLAGPPYNTPPDALNDRVEEVYGAGTEVDATVDENGDFLLKMRYRIQ